MIGAKPHGPIPSIAAVLAAWLCLACYQARAADLGATYVSYSEMHTKSKYGAVFFATGATEKADIRRLHVFTEVSGDGDLLLPTQSGYCFVVNHYSVELGYAGLTRHYRASISKQFGHSPPLSQSVRYSFLPTSEPESEQVDDVCISHLTDVTAIAIDIRLDNATVRTISFKPH